MIQLASKLVLTANRCGTSRSNKNRFKAPLNTSHDCTTDSPCSDATVLRRTAMDYLARREHSALELQRKLLHRFPDASSALISEVLVQLRRDHLQSDERFAECWVRYRQSRGFGYLHILTDLKERGIASEVVDRYLYLDDDNWTAMAKSLISKRLAADEKIEFGSKTHRRLMRFLQSRGFGGREIQRAVEPYLSQC